MGFMPFIIKKQWLDKGTLEYLSSDPVEGGVKYNWTLTKKTAQRFTTKEKAQSFIDTAWPESTRHIIDSHWQEYPFIIEQVK